MGVGRGTEPAPDHHQGAPVFFPVRLFFCLLTLAVMTMFPAEPVSAQDPYATARRLMLDDIAALARETQRETSRAAYAPRVMDAMASVPRHRFVPADEAAHAYANRPLPIGYGQTISQPFIVALMTELLDLKGGERVLEVGTGSGYQAVVLAGLAREVYTVERLAPLAQEAAARLAQEGYASVRTRTGDGYAGWPEAAPFDAIMVTAGAPEVPPALVEQLAPGGRLVIPVGAQRTGQELLLITKDPQGRVSRRSVLAVRFVPLVPGPAH
jgi:protein-L-isoaspartate(D-aspartate) O-methyltransferase